MMTDDELPTSRKVEAETQRGKWGPREFKTHKSHEEGSVMLVCSKTFPTIQKENTIKHAADSMSENESRRLFVTEPDDTLLGLVSATDIVDFLGGGDKFNLIEKKYGERILPAINEHVRKIMEEDVVTLSHKAVIDDALEKMHEEDVGYLPLLKENKVQGVISERNFVKLVSKQLSDSEVSDFMSEDVILGTSGMKIRDIAKVIVRNGFRRIPIVREKELIGIITTRDIVTEFAEDFSSDILDKRIDKIMREPVTASPDDLATDVAEMIVSKDIGGFPVVKDGNVVGIITEKDILDGVA